MLQVRPPALPQQGSNRRAPLNSLPRALEGMQAGDEPPGRSTSTTSGIASSCIFCLSWPSSFPASSAPSSAASRPASGGATTPSPPAPAGYRSWCLEISIQHSPVSCFPLLTQTHRASSWSHGGERMRLIRGGQQSHATNDTYRADAGIFVSIISSRACGLCLCLL